MFFKVVDSDDWVDVKSYKKILTKLKSFVEEDDLPYMLLNYNMELQMIITSYNISNLYILSGHCIPNKSIQVSSISLVSVILQYCLQKNSQRRLYHLHLLSSQML